MKNIYRIAGLLCLFICCKTSFAGNILGAEITYKHVAGDSFDVSLRVYRDCNGSGTIDPTVEISNTCTTYNQSLALISSRDATGIPQNCPQQSKCSSGSFKYGIEERIYRDRVKLDSGSCNYYNLCWTRDSLSDSITTGYAGQPLFVCAYIALSANPANSSAEFNFPPKFFLNYGKDAHINLSAADIDADSVSYELVGFNSTVWMPSYPYSRPFTYLGFPITSLNFPAGIHLDSSFGILRFRPVSKGQVGVYSVRVKEWRKIAGVATVVGMVSRLSVGYVTSDSISNSPRFSSYTTVAGGNGNTNFAQENICNNSTQTYCNEFKFSDADTTDTLYFNYRYSLTNITFTNIGSATKPIIKVCYTPTLAELSTGKPLNFKIEVNDGKCPLPGTSELVFTYKVLAPLPDSFAIDKSLTCRDITLKAINNSSLPTSKFRMGWDIKNERDALPKYYNGDSITAKLDSGWNKIKLFAQDRNFGGASQPYCDRRIYEDSVYIDPILHIEINAGPDTTLCNDPVLPLNPAVSRGTAPFTYQWEDNSTSLPRVFNATRKNDTLQVTVTDSNNCRALDTVFVNYFNPRVTITGDTANCINSTIILNAGLSGITSPYHFEWVGFNALTVTIKPALSATTKYDFTLTDGSGCVVQASRTVTAYDPKVVPSHIASVCNKDSIHFTASTAGGMAPHTVSWPTFSQTGASVGIKADSAGIINYTVIVTDAFGCTSQETGTVTVHELPVLIPVYPMQVCAGDSISLSASINGGQAPYSINWSPFGLPGSSVKVSAPVAGPVNFTTEVTDSNGCKTSETGQVTVNALPVVIAASPGIICQSAQRVSLASFGTPAGGVWTGMNIAGDSLSTADTGLHALHYGYTDATTGCTNNDTTAAYVELQPVAGFSADSMKGPVSYVFNFTNTSTKAIYNTTHWDFGDPASGTANTAATVNAAHTFSDSGTYTVRLIISGGICDPDTEIQVITVYRPSTTSVKEKAGVTAKMYPNPARQEFTVEGENISGIRVTDLQGREIKASVTPLDKLRHNVRMDGVSPGMYLVQIIYSDQLVFVYNLVVTY